MRTIIHQNIVLTTNWNASLKNLLWRYSVPIPWNGLTNSGLQNNDALFIMKAKEVNKISQSCLNVLLQDVTMMLEQKISKLETMFVRLWVPEELKWDAELQFLRHLQCRLIVSIFHCSCCHWIDGWWYCRLRYIKNVSASSRYVSCMNKSSCLQHQKRQHHR